MYICICNKNVEIKLSAHDAFLELPSSDTLKIGRLESQVIYKILGAIKTKGLMYLYYFCTIPPSTIPLGLSISTNYHDTESLLLLLNVSCLVEKQ